MQVFLNFIKLHMMRRNIALRVAAATALILAVSTPATATDTPTTDGTASSSAHTFRPGAKPQAFQAEVTRLMEILVRNLYSNEDIFLRELISNAADALDKVRFVSLTNTTALGDTPEAASLPLDIKITADPERGILSIRDTGIGMTRADLSNNLGTIARSGTAAFLEQMQKGGDLNLIGQFGVGFYSSYLVADYVEVTTKHADDVQLVWESAAQGSFAISRDEEGEALGRGTRIDLHLKEGSKTYLKESKLKELVQKYSEFINFPIQLLVEKTLEKEVLLEEDQDDEETTDEKPAFSEEEEEKKKADKGVAVEEEDDKEAKDSEGTKKKTKTVTETVKEWETLNDAKALWLRPPGNVSEEEHEKFYQVLSKSPWDKPMAHTHFRAEGDVDFKAVLYVPQTPPQDMYENYHSTKARLKLYVRRVFISDSFEDILPKWLSFLVGLVDSDDMPLNVSREVLQMSQGLKVIRKKLVRKAIDMIKKLSDGAEAGPEEVEQGKKGFLGIGGGSNKEKVEATEKKAKEAKEKYEDFWKKYGKAIKMGIVEDTSNRPRLMPLLRFKTTTSGGNLTTLDAYLSRMVTNQTGIYYLVGTGSIDEMQASPFVEAVTAKGIEVILFNDPLDEYCMTHVTEYEDKQFINVSKDDLKLPESESDKEKEAKANEQYKGLSSWWKTAINDTTVSNVKISRRLNTAPCVVASGRWGWSAAMERIASAQALANPEKATFARGQRTLEINPRHPLVRRLRERWEEDKEDAGLISDARTLYESCLLASGYLLDDPRHHTSRVLELLAVNMGVEDLKPLDEEEYEVKKDDTIKTVDLEEEEVVVGGGVAANEKGGERTASTIREEKKEEEKVKVDVKDEL